MKLKITYTNGKSYHINHVVDFDVYKKASHLGYDIHVEYERKDDFGESYISTITDTHDVAETLETWTEEGVRHEKRSVYAKLENPPVTKNQVEAALKDVSNGWIANDGNSDNIIPLKDGEIYEVIFKNGGVKKGIGWLWNLGVDDYDIIKYRIVPE